MTERAGPVPPWVQVTAALRERILSGELAPGAMVPSIVALNQRAMIVASVCRRLADDAEADAMDTALAAASIRDRCADFPVNYSVNPLGM